ncbi:MAG TPA: hypothetical protein VMV20_02585 [Chitinophagaceae bacterium]|nr:hypothetical protein [Chitinophagaceae bacterium]
MLQRIFAGLTLLVFLIGTTPRDFLHQEFAHHKDTVDGIHHETGVSIQHIHCDFLHILLAQYVSGHTQVLPAAPSSFLDLNCTCFIVFHSTFFAHASLRAPPGC